MNTQRVIEQAIVNAGKAEYDRLTAGMNTQAKVSKVDFALQELMKLQNSDEMPGYADPFVTLFYSLWFLPSQINLACAVIDGSLRLHGEWRIIDFGCGSGAMSIGLAIAAGTSRLFRFPGSIQVHGIDCPTMLGFGKKLWREIREVSSQERNAELLHGLRRIHPSSYQNVDDLLEAVGTWLEGPWNVGLSALHVAYGANVSDVSQSVRKLWDTANPKWGTVTTADFGKKRDYAQGIAPWQAPKQASVSLPFSGVLDELTGLRKDIRKELPAGDEFSLGGLLMTEVNWVLNHSPIVLRYPSA